MTEMTDDEVDLVDLAVVAYRDEGRWCLQQLPGRALDSIETIVRELRRYPGENGALALIAVDDDFALVVRVQGEEDQVLLSDASAATDWTLAHSAVDHLGVHVDDEDEQVPAGDLGIAADMGCSAAELGALIDDEELYPDELLAELAQRLGFGDRFDELAEMA